jgi:uncharacterized protein (TIGR02145 family)
MGRIGGVIMNFKAFTPFVVLALTGALAWNCSSVFDNSDDASGGGKGGKFTDSRDGKEYRYVTIGTQKWMAENLNYSTDAGSWCYGDIETACNRCGRLYDWNTAMTVCPAGWHLPSSEEWDILVDYAGGESAAGGKLKAKNGWSSDGNGTDNFGFSALPCGSCSSSGQFNYLGYSAGLWWSISPRGIPYADRRAIYYYNESVYSDSYNTTNGLSVRCVK